MIKDDKYSKPGNQASSPFRQGESWDEKSLYVLQLLKQGTAADVAGRLAEIDGTENVSVLEEHIEKSLSFLCHAQIIQCRLQDQVMVYYTSGYKPDEDLQ